MRFEQSKVFKKMYKKLPRKIQILFIRKGDFLKQNISHPSLRIKKMSRFQNPEIWELSLSMNFRVTFEIQKNVIFFRKIGDHEILKSP